MKVSDHYSLRLFTAQHWPTDYSNNMSADTAAPPFYALTNDNHAAVVVVAAVTFLIYAILGIGAKLLIRLNIASLKGHDTVLIAGAVLYFAETVCVIVACNNGLGQHKDAVSLDVFEEYSKVGE